MKKRKIIDAYRFDIDGLRAIAVLSVILFHIDRTIIPGGFIGVDIFFVISGYLISLHIFQDIIKDNFSIIEFYRRRVKRIAPVMLAVIAVTMITTQFIFRPEDAEKVAESGLWSLFSLANVYFWLYQDTSYFAAASNELPLLHLWSLGVEEQFYIFWPIILMLVYRAKNSKLFISISIIIAASSLLLAEILYTESPSFVYYMLPTRAGELLIGAITAQIILTYGEKSIAPTITIIASITGLSLIFLSFFLLTEEQVFPGLRAIPPTVGTALLILSGNYNINWPSRLLMLPPMVKMGLISYSAYLWHWPLLSYMHYAQIEINFLSGLLVLMLTMFLALLSYLYIEKPTRYSTKSALQIFTKQYILPAGTLAIIAIVAMKLDGYGVRWFSDSYQEKRTLLKNQIKPAYEYNYVCQNQIIKPENVNDKRCIVGSKSDTSPNVLLWGDSNAAHFVGMIGYFAQEAGFSFQNMEIGACPPINSDPIDFVNPKRLSDCRKSRDIAWETVNRFPIIIISSNWSSYQERSKNFLPTFFSTVKELAKQNKLIILLGKVPVIAGHDRLCSEKALSIPFLKCKTAPELMDSKVSQANKLLRNFSKKTKNVEYYEITNYLCTNNKCSVYDKNNMLLYFDVQHLSLSASWKIGKTIYTQNGIPFPFTLIPKNTD